MPKATPEAVVERLQRACRDAVAAAETRTHFERMKVVSMYMPGADYAEKLRRESLAVGNIVRESGIPRQD